MADNITKFLETYKELEANIRTRTDITPDANESFIACYEAELEKTDVTARDKLRVCRVMRNFIQHNPNAKNFLMPTEAQTKFLQSLVDEIASRNGTIKDKYKTFAKSPYVIRLTDTVRDVLLAFHKYQTPIIVLNEADLPMFYLLPEDMLLIAILMTEGFVSKTSKVKALFAKKVADNFEVGIKVETSDFVDIRTPLDKVERRLLPYIVTRNEKAVGTVKV